MQDFSQADMLAPQDWSFPVPIIYGPERLEEVGARCAALGYANPLIVTDKGSAHLPFIERLQTILSQSGLRHDSFSGVSPNPLDGEIAEGRAFFLKGGHDAVIGVGGGSAMDGAKGIALTANNEIDLWAFEFEQTPPRIDAPFPGLITIPTTAGTGAECASTAMATHSAKQMKLCVWHPELEPALAVLDPALTLSLPPNLTAWTGADAMTHAIEAYLVPGFHPLCDAMAIEGLALIAHWLPKVMKEPEDIAARGGMLAGSCLAGIAFSKGLGLTHAISHMVGAEFNTQHGLTNAVLLPAVLRFNQPGQEAKMRRMAQTMGLDDHSAPGFIAGVEQILDDLDIPRSLTEIGALQERARSIAEKASLDSAAATNPRAASIEEIEALVNAAF